MQLVPIQADPQQMVAGNHQQQATQLANQANSIRRLEGQVDALGRIIVRGIEAMQGLQQDNRVLQGRVGQLELERDAFEQRVTETETRNQELTQNMANMQADNAQMAQRIRAIELEEDAKKVDQLRDAYINGGSNRLGGG